MPSKPPFENVRMSARDREIAERNWRTAESIAQGVVSVTTGVQAFVARVLRAFRLRHSAPGRAA